MHLPRFTFGLVEARRDRPPRSAGHWHGPYVWPSWVVDWISQPGQRLEITEPGGRPQVVERPPQSWCAFAPGVAYRHFDPTPAPPAPTRWFFFDLHAPFAPLSGRALSVLVDPEERIAAHVDAMFDFQQHGEPGSDLAAHGHALAVFGEIALASRRGHAGTADDPWPVRAPVAAASAERLLQRVDAAVLRRFDRPPALADLAAGVHLSSSALSHRFQRETGMSVMVRVRWLRIREARRLLADPDATVAAVARAVGFSSPFHLSRVFSQVTGMSPQEFRRRSRTSPTTGARD